MTMQPDTDMPCLWAVRLGLDADLGAAQLSRLEMVFSELLDAPNVVEGVFKLSNWVKNL